MVTAATEKIQVGFTVVKLLSQELPVGKRAEGNRQTIALKEINSLGTAPADNR